jgi:hypothetical protein
VSEGGSFQTVGQCSGAPYPCRCRQDVTFYINKKFYGCDLKVFAVAEYLTGLQEAARLLQPSLLPLLSMLHPGPEYLRENMDD